MALVMQNIDRRSIKGGEPKLVITGNGCVNPIRGKPGNICSVIGPVIRDYSNNKLRVGVSRFGVLHYPDGHAKYDVGVGLSVEERIQLRYRALIIIDDVTQLGTDARQRINQTVDVGPNGDCRWIGIDAW